MTHGPMETLVLDVAGVAHGGHCVARAESGYVVFVRHALPGERVRAVVTERRSGYLRADACEVIRPSPHRVTPPCPFAGPGRCGGCDFQHATVAAQRELKASVVREQLVRLAGLSPDEVEALQVRVEALPPVEGEPDGLGWRTRVRYAVDDNGRLGFRRHRSHDVVVVDRCLLAHPRVRDVPVLQRSWEGARDVEVVASGPTVLVDGRRVLGPARVPERAAGREWSVPAGAFWQVHPAAADTLAAAVVDLLDPRPGERAWDLYGGVGLFAAAIAARVGDGVGVTVVESDRRAAVAARRCLSDLAGVSVLASDVERALPRLPRPDLIVLDPPRAGAGRGVVAGIVAAAPRAVAYVACDPAALARDLRTFRDAGWHVAALRAFDCFPHTHHVECVALLLPPSRTP